MITYRNIHKAFDLPVLSGVDMTEDKIVRLAMGLGAQKEEAA